MATDPARQTIDDVTRRRVSDLVREAVQRLNRELHYDSLRDPKRETPLFGGESSIDSLSLVSLVVELETRVEEEFGRDVVLADAGAMSSRRSPYRTVGSLTDLVLERLA